MVIAFKIIVSVTKCLFIYLFFENGKEKKLVASILSLPC